MDSLAFGAIAAIVWRRNDPRLFAIARLAAPALVAIALVCFAAGWFDRRSAMSNVACYAVVPAATASVIVGLVSGAWPRVAAVLSSRPFVAVGRISYGLYLFHPLTIGFIEDTWKRVGIDPWASLPRTLLYAVTCAASAYAVALLLYRTVEAPFLRQKQRLAPYASGGGAR
jgi:peptidoglycan/LPS O-acetylase OafA/YrhL